MQITWGDAVSLHGGAANWMQVLCQSGDRRPVHMQHVQDRHGFSRGNNYCTAQKNYWNFWGICKDWICQREAMQLCSFKLPVRQNCSAEVREGEAVYSWLTKVRHFEAPGIQLLPPCQLSQNEWKIHGNARKAQGSCLKRSTRSWFVTSQEVDGWFMMNLKMMMPSDLPGAVAYSQSSCCNYLHPQRRYKPSESSACAEPAKLSFITLSWCHWYSSNQ